MSEFRYIFLDTETGGIGLDKSLLTAYFRVLRDDFKFINDCYLQLKPNDGIYHVTPEGLGINKINLVEHDKAAKTYKEGGTWLYNFLKTCSEDGRMKLIPVGHGMSGDLDHIYDKLMSRATWENFVSYRRLDTAVVANFLRLTGHLPNTVTGSLESLAIHFNIDASGAHDAVGDVKMIVNVLERMMALI